MSFTHKPLPDPPTAAEKTPQNAAAAENRPKTLPRQSTFSPGSYYRPGLKGGPLAPVRITDRG